jgi:hypothetical protein
MVSRDGLSISASAEPEMVYPGIADSESAWPGGAGRVRRPGPAGRGGGSFQTGLAGRGERWAVLSDCDEAGDPTVLTAAPGPSWWDLERGPHARLVARQNSSSNSPHSRLQGHWRSFQTGGEAKLQCPHSGLQGHWRSFVLTPGSRAGSVRADGRMGGQPGRASRTNGLRIRFRREADSRR